MTSRTHKEFSITFVYLAVFYIYTHSVLDIEYYALLAIMLCIGAKGALFPDVDHVWKNVKEKTFFNRVINWWIYITGGTHRSYQTHSIDVCLISAIGFIGLNRYCYEMQYIGEVNYQVHQMILFGFYAGWISHLVSDMLTSGGVNMLFLRKKHIKIVPKKIGKFRFNTGNQWEAFVYMVTLRVNLFMSIFALIFPFIFDERWSLWLMQLI